MTAPLLYVTGTNTGVGKTTLACLLLRRAKEKDLDVAALKPFCSGGREDAERLHMLQTTGLTVDEVNPFYFEEPIAPYVAAQNANRTITLSKATQHIENVSARGMPFLIEGAGGVMTPLGGRFTLLDLISKAPGPVCVVGANTLGVINSALLTHRALKSIHSKDVRFILMNSPQPDASAGSNGDVIREWTESPVFEFPFLRAIEEQNIAATAVLDSLLQWWLNGN